MSIYYLRAYSTSNKKDSIIEKLESFGRLPNGWHYGEGEPISKEVIGVAKRFYNAGKLLGIKTEVFPGVGDSITLSLHKRLNTLELIVNADLLTEIEICKGSGSSFESITIYENVDPNVVIRVIQVFATYHKEWNSQGSFTRKNIASKTKSLTKTASKTTGNQYRWSTSTASRKRPEVFANT